MRPIVTPSVVPHSPFQPKKWQLTFIRYHKNLDFFFIFYMHFNTDGFFSTGAHWSAMHGSVRRSVRRSLLSTGVWQTIICSGSIWQLTCSGRKSWVLVVSYVLSYFTSSHAPTKWSYRFVICSICIFSVTIKNYWCSVWFYGVVTATQLLIGIE